MKQQDGPAPGWIWLTGKTFSHVMLSGMVAASVLMLMVVMGCSRPTVSVEVPKEMKVEDTSAERLRTARDSLSQATEAAHFRNALLLLADHMHQADVRERLLASKEYAGFLSKEVGLNKAEIDEVQSPSFQALDARYLEETFLLGNVARELRRGGLTDEERARQALHWVCRFILLDGESGFSRLPPGALLMRGFGSPHDRALVFLGVLRQLELPACLIDGPHPLVGVILPKKKGLSLFDPMLDMAIEGPDGKGIATLAEATSQPELLKSPGMDVKVLANSTLELYTPMTGLSPRMAELQRLFYESDRVSLFVEAGELGKQIAEASGKPVKIGNASTRLLREFVPVDEGGVDRSGRIRAFQQSLLPYPRIAGQLWQMKLVDQYLNSEARNFLIARIQKIYETFVIESRQIALRGGDPTKRIERIRRQLEDLEFVPIDEDNFQSELNKWREMAQQVHLARQRKLPNSDQIVAAFWGQDQYLNQLVRVEGEQASLEQFKKTVLTFIVLRAVSERVGLRTSFLLATSRQSEAERLQAIADHRRDAGEDAGRAQSNARNTWQDCRSFWNKYVERYSLNPSTVRIRLQNMSRGSDSHIGDTAQLLLYDWARSCFARMQLARALQGEGKASNARAVLTELKRDLDNFDPDGETGKAINIYLNRLAGNAIGATLIDTQRPLAEQLRANSTLQQQLQQLVLLQLNKLGK